MPQRVGNAGNRLLTKPYREFREQKEVEVDTTHDLPGLVQPDLSLCVFRVLEEALRGRLPSGSGPISMRVAGREMGQDDSIHCT